MERLSNIAFRLFRKPGIDKLHAAALEKIRSRGVARVCFIASNLSMWRMEEVWRIMSRDPRFDCRIILIPLGKYLPEVREYEKDKLRKHFESKGIPYYEEECFTGFDPDIVFYQQFYSHSYLDPVRAKHNEFRLLCYSPYGIMFIDKKWQYNSRFHNVAWKIYMQSELHRQTSYRLADNHGRNTVVVGDSDYDSFAASELKDVWKPQEQPKKRIIWAPHHRKLKRDSLSWTAEKMKELAEKYQDTVQFAFKPHPMLKTQLYKEWGREATDKYYEFWAAGPNTQLETGAFVDLFRGSDALIHDCNSFIAEYMYTGRPALFVSTNTEKIRAGFSQFGKDALDAHYKAVNPEEIEGFINDVVLGGKDSMAGLRKAVYENYLKPRSGKGFAEGVYADIVESVWG